MSSNRGWIGVDLDGTLAEYHGWVHELHIGAPIPLMVKRVKAWLAEGRDVRIFTARVATSPDGKQREDDRSRSSVPLIVKAIDKWCFEHLGRALPVTNIKDFGMIELWDDRCVQVVRNTGDRADRVV